MASNRTGYDSSRYQRQRAEAAKALTSERIAAHLETFLAAGGKVERLGNTHVLKKIGGERKS